MSNRSCDDLDTTNFSIPNLYPIKITFLDSVVQYPSLLSECCLGADSAGKLILTNRVIVFDPKCSTEVASKFSPQTSWFPSDLTLNKLVEANEIFHMLKTADYWLLFADINCCPFESLIENQDNKSFPLSLVILIDVRHDQIDRLISQAFSKVSRETDDQLRHLIEVFYRDLLEICCAEVLNKSIVNIKFTVNKDTRASLMFSAGRLSGHVSMDTETKGRNWMTRSSKLDWARRIYNRFQTLRTGRKLRSRYKTLNLANLAFQYVHFVQGHVVILSLEATVSSRGKPPERKLTLLAVHKLVYGGLHAMGEDTVAASWTPLDPYLVNGDLSQKAFDDCHAKNNNNNNNGSHQSRYRLLLSNTSALSSVESLSIENSVAAGQWVDDCHLAESSYTPNNDLYPVIMGEGSGKWLSRTLSDTIFLTDGHRRMKTLKNRMSFGSGVITITTTEGEASDSRQF